MKRMKTKAILTGHSRGLGTGIATALLERGIPVLGLSRRADLELGERFPGLLQQTPLDLADAAAFSAWLAGDAMRRFLGDCELALLVNNAGVVTPIGPLPTQPTKAVSDAITVNVAGPLMLAAAFVAATHHVTERRVLHVSSGAGRNPYPGWSVYCATKAALDQHARCVVLDQTPRLRICSLAPGIIDTGMQSEIRATDPQRFPMHERFVAMARDGALADPMQAGAKIAAHLLGSRFGESAVADLREVDAAG